MTRTVVKFIIICVLFLHFKNSIPNPQHLDGEPKAAVVRWLVDKDTDNVTSNLTFVEFKPVKNPSTTPTLLTQDSSLHEQKPKPQSNSSSGDPVNTISTFPASVGGALSVVPIQHHPQTGSSVTEHTQSNNPLTKMQMAALEKLNFYRTKHKVPLLKMSAKLNKQSQDWALKVAAEGKIRHSCINGDCVYGENAAREPPNKDLAAAFVHAVTAWCDEVKFYDFKKGEPIGGAVTGHFTQVVWKGSTEVGFGAAVTSTDKFIYIFAQFLPAGNYDGEYTENVFL